MKKGATISIAPCRPHIPAARWWPRGTSALRAEFESPRPDGGPRRRRAARRADRRRRLRLVRHRIRPRHHHVLPHSLLHALSPELRTARAPPAARRCASSCWVPTRDMLAANAAHLGALTRPASTSISAARRRWSIAIAAAPRCSTNRNCCTHCRRRARRRATRDPGHGQDAPRHRRHRAAPSIARWPWKPAACMNSWCMPAPRPTATSRWCAGSGSRASARWSGCR
jgi:hypothetical protein